MQFSAYMTTTMVMLVVAALMVLHLVGDLWLEWLNRREVRRAVGSPPPAALAIMDAATFRRSSEYTLAHQRLDVLESIFEAECWRSSSLVDSCHCSLCTWRCSRRAPRSGMMPCSFSQPGCCWRCRECL